MLLVIYREVLTSSADKEHGLLDGVPVFLVAQATPDHRNLFLSTAERRPRRGYAFIGVPSSRASRSKSFDFTLDLDSLEVRSYSDRFTCDQVLLVDDKDLYDYLIGRQPRVGKDVLPVGGSGGGAGGEETQEEEAEAEEKEDTDETVDRDLGTAKTPTPIRSRGRSRLATGHAIGSSYLEHHSALVKLASVFLSFSPGKELLVLLLVDTLLGVWLGPRLCSWWPVVLESAVPEVRRIVAWLRTGTPLGLKLNPQVNQALAKFFTCHVNMWHVYIDVMLPSLRALTDAVAARPWLPLSVQCSLVCDIITLATVHVYCFYGYMCKIYSVCLSGLLALLRIFRGRKWNPLRQRVDSLADSDPVLVGPIILTILVFLSPTIVLYYVIFSMMRCSVLVVNFSLGTVVHDVQTLVFSLLKCATRQPVINVRKTSVVRMNEFALKAEPSYTRGMGKLLVTGLRRLIRLKELLTFCRDLCMGRIVYPL